MLSSGYDRCVRCGLCLPACPTYTETLVETSGPRGRIALMKSVEEGTLDAASPGFVHQMSECLGCRACEAACPSGVPYGALLESARERVAVREARAQPWMRRWLRSLWIGWLFGRLWHIRLVAGLLRFAQRFGLDGLAQRIGLLRLLGLESAASLAPRLSPHFFTPRGQRWRAETLETRATTFLHVGCVMHVAFAEVNEATVNVLRRAGCDVLAPGDQGCCGAIAIHAGELERGRVLAKENICAFERSGADVYVTNAAGCGAALKEYGELLAGDDQWRERARAFSEKVRDVTELLDEIGIAPDLGPIDAVVTYQDPCHLVHAQRISAAPRQLLQLIPGLQLREHADSSVCCGSAGLYNLTQPEMAQRLQARKVANILAAEPNVIATTNPGCALQIAAGLRDAGRPIPIKHVVQLLDDSYSAYTPLSS